MRFLLTLLLTLGAAAPASAALPAGALTPVPGKQNCVGALGAPCKTITRGLVNPVRGAFSDDGRSFYVGSLGNGGVFAYARDPRSGRLAPVQQPACLGFQLGCARTPQQVMPEAIVVTHDGRFVYAGGANGDDGLLAFSRDPQSGALAPAGCLVTARGACTFPHGGSSAADIQALAVTPDDRFLVVAGVSGIGVVDRDPATGALAQTAGNCFAAERYPDEISEDCRYEKTLGRPLNIALTDDGRNVYVAAESGGLHTFALDRATGTLTHQGRIGSGYYEVTATPDGRSVYAVSEDFDLHAFTRDPATGALARVRGRAGCFTVAPGCTYLKGIPSPEDLRAAPDSRHLYVAGPEGVTVLKRTAGGGLRHLRGRGTCATIDGTDGILAGHRRPQECIDGAYRGNNLTGFEVAPDGRHAYALMSTRFRDGRAFGVVQPLARR